MSELCTNHLTGEFGVTNKIKQSMYNVCKEFVYVGFLLHEVDIYEYYKEGGYESVVDYAYKELGFKKSSTYNFINVCLNFCLPAQPNSNIPSMLMPTYENFNYSQLCEMLSLSEKQKKLCSPGMSVRQIRELKKQSNNDIFQTSGKIEGLAPDVPAPEAPAPEAPVHEKIENKIIHINFDCTKKHYNFCFSRKDSDYIIDYLEKSMIDEWIKKDKSPESVIKEFVFECIKERIEYENMSDDDIADLENWSHIMNGTDI